MFHFPSQTEFFRKPVRIYWMQIQQSVVGIRREHWQHALWDLRNAEVKRTERDLIAFNSTINLCFLAFFQVLCINGWCGCDMKWRHFGTRSEGPMAAGLALLSGGLSAPGVGRRVFQHYHQCSCCCSQMATCQCTVSRNERILGETYCISIHICVQRLFSFVTYCQIHFRWVPGTTFCNRDILQS